MFTRISKVNGPLVQTVLTKTTVARSIAFVAGHLLTSLATGTTAEGTLGGLAKSFKASIEEVFMGVAEANSISNVVSVIPRGRSGAIYSGLTFKGEYFVDTDGTISKTGLIYAGTAIKTTELLIKN